MNTAFLKMFNILSIKIMLCIHRSDITLLYFILLYIYFLFVSKLHPKLSK